MYLVIYPARAFLGLLVETVNIELVTKIMKTETICTFSLSRMWKKARRSMDSSPVDLNNGGKVRCSFALDSDIVERKTV